MPTGSRKAKNKIWLAVLISSLCACQTRQQKLFTDVSASSGISFSNMLTESEALNVLNFEYMYNGAGVAVGDLNNDGLPDLYFTANQTENKLYLNKGNLKFEDITAGSGAGGKSGWKTGVTMADVNGDGLLDIYVCYSGKTDYASRSNQLFINQGLKNGIPVFTDQAAAYGLDAPGSNATQAVFFDYDRDGDLDMFLLNHATTFYAPFFNTSKLRNKRHPYFSNYLFRNDGGHFTDVSVPAGIKGGGNNFGLGVTVSDINNDGWPDLYYTNDYEEQDFLLLNNHDGTFTDATKKSLSHLSKYAMGCDIADCNNDGRMDIMVLDMLPEDNHRQKLLKGPDEYDKYQLLVDSGYFHQQMRNTLQLNQGMDDHGIPLFSEIGQLAGISNTDWSWSPLFADFDNDGQKDLFITNGYYRDYTNMDFLSFKVAEYRKTNPGAKLGYQLVQQMPQTKIRKYIFKNDGNLHFSDSSSAWGVNMPAVSNGAVYVDLDNDGDLDLVVNNLGAQASIYRNNSELHKDNHYLRVLLADTGGNRFAIGARVEIESASGQKQYCEMQPVRGFQSSVDRVLHFGLGKDSVINYIKIYWPDGLQTIRKKIASNQTITITKEDPVIVAEPTPVAGAVFSDISQSCGIHFLKNENKYVDFKTEFLLPWQTSKQGPRLAKGDVNGDGLEDLFIGAPLGQIAALYLQQPNGKFLLSASHPWRQDSLCEDIQPLFFDADNDGDLDLYVVSGGNEPHQHIKEMQDRLYINDGKGNFTKAENALPGISSSKSCVAAADFDKDGKIDLFVGGRLIPGSYGLSPSSCLLKNESKGKQLKFVNVIQSVAPELETIGMVTDAVWQDINQDGWPDLILVGEWMPIQIFINNKGVLINQSTAFGLNNSGGLWTRIIPMDIDGDGDMDFLLGNLAPNTLFKASALEPMTLCVNDYFKTGNTVPLLCYYIQGKSYPFASKDELTETMPALKKKFFHYADYADATLQDIFTDAQMKGMQVRKVQETKNCWLEQKTNAQWVLRELPAFAQFAPIQGAVAGDFMHNGKSEIFAVGNFYPFRVQIGREDAGKGILMSYNGKESSLGQSLVSAGVIVDGDIRDIVSLQSSNQKRILVVAKNNAPIQVIRN